MTRLMCFHETGNLGDMMQAVALSRLIGPSTGFFRDQPDLNFPEDSLGIAAGFLLGAQQYNPAKTLFAGIWFPVYHDGHTNWLAKTKHPIGARDPHTYNGLQKRGLKSEMIGCATLTLPRFEGRRYGAVSVDVEGGPGMQLSHKVPTTWKFAREWKECLERLNIYRRAEVIYTTRIHAALPALAMGTPVVYTGPQDGRTSILKELGVEWGKASAPSVLPMALRYRNFLYSHSGLDNRDWDYPMPKVKEGA